MKKQKFATKICWLLRARFVKILPIRLKRILGKDTKKADDRPLDVVDKYVSENTSVLVDPLEIKVKMDYLANKKATLIRELETQIKVANATTFIEI